MDDVPHFERYAARGATIRTDGVEGVEIDGEKTDVAHAHLLRALQLDDAASHIEADAHKAVRYETMKAAKADKLMAKRAQRERARRERKKQVWAARDKLLSQPEQVTARTNSCVDNDGNENAGSDDDDDDDDDDCSESTNDSIPHAFCAPQKKKMTCTEVAMYKMAKALAVQQRQTNVAYLITAVMMFVAVTNLRR